MKSLFVGWQDAVTREWVPVARLDRTEESYCFYYTQGALRVKGFRPFGRMDILDAVYVSKELFPFFENRLLSRSRPEFPSFLKWTGLRDDAIDDPMRILAVTGGARGTDPIELFPLPMKTKADEFEVDFFVRGLRHFADPNLRAADELAPGARLFVMRDVQNDHDSYALCLRTDEPTYLVGYCPRYYTQDICRLLDLDAKALKITVTQVNAGAPLGMRLLCKLRAPWPDGFEAFSGNDDFRPVRSD